MGLEHIVLRHWHSAGVAGTSKFSRTVDAKALKGMIKEARESGATWRLEGSNWVIETNAGRVIGTDTGGNPTSWYRVVVTGSGDVVTAYPISGLLQ